MSKYAFGVDIGGTTVKLGLFDKEANVLKKWEIVTRKDNGGEMVLPDVAESIRKVMEEMNIAKEEVIGIGIGVPGGVDQNGTVNAAVNLGWGTMNIPSIVNQYLDIPVKAGNDANVAALGEMWQGGGRGYKDLVAVTLGTGVGGGIIVGGEILNGSKGAAGEIGHIRIEENETECCGCGCKGCLEQYASASGIVRLAVKRLAKDDTPSILRGNANITAKDVFDAVKEKDKVAIEIAQQFGEYLGKGLQIIAAVMDPEVFVIGGGVSKAGEILFDYIKPAYLKYAFHASKNVKFELATLGNDAGIYGAAGLFLLD